MLGPQMSGNATWRVAEGCHGWVPHPCGFHGAGFDLLRFQRIVCNPFRALQFAYNYHSESRASGPTCEGASAHFHIDSAFQLCSHVVNTNSQIGTTQRRYPALSYPVKSLLAALPAPATPPNSFPFCTRTFSSSNFQRTIRSEFRFSLSKFRVTPLSTAFTPNLLLSPLSTAFTQITRGVPLKAPSRNEK